MVTPLNSELLASIAHLMSHGTGSPTKMSKMLEPTDELTAISACPFRATAMELTASGIDVAAARNVTLDTIVGIPITVATVSVNHTSKKVKLPIHSNDKPKVTKKNLEPFEGHGRVK